MGVRNALTFVGAVVGGFFGPAGAQLGMAIGGIIGGMVDPQEVRLPGLRDIQIQRQGEGQPIVELAGTAGGAGTLIYCSDPDIRQVKEKQGKGTSAVTVQDRVYLTFALQIGSSIFDGPGHREGRKRLIKIRLGDKLVYDVSPTSEILAESAEFAKCFTYYPGDYTQLPDPHIEAIEGVGNVSAYRGTAYVVFHNFDTTDYGGVPPQFFFETADDGEQYSTITLATDVRCYSGAPTALAAASDPGFLANTSKIAISASGRLLAGGGPNEAVWRRFDPTTETWIDLGSLPGLNPGEEVFCLAWSPDETYLAAGIAGLSPLPLPWCPVAVWQRTGDTLTRLAPPSSFNHSSSLGGIAWDDAGQRLALTLNTSETVVYDFVAGSLVSPRYVDLSVFGGGARNVEFMPGGRYLLAGGVARSFLLRDEGDSLQLAASAAVAGGGGIFRDASGGYAIAVGGGSPNGVVTVMEIVESTVGGEALNVESTYTTDIPFNVGRCAISGDRRYLAIPASSGQQYPTIVALSAGTPPTCSAVANPPALGEQVQAVGWPAQSTLPQYVPGYTTYAALVKAVGRRCGIPDSAWGLPGLDEKIVRGFAVGSQQYTGADAINALRLVVPSDVACFDGKIHIFLRGGAVDMELDDQFQVDEGLDAESGELLQSGDEVRKTPARLPAKVNLMFPNAAMGYAMTKATSPDDGDGPSLSEVTLEVPVVLDEETEAPQLADILAKVSRTEAEGEFGGLYPMDIALAAATGTVVRHTSGGVQRRTVVKGFRYYDGKVRLTLGLDRPADYQSNASARPSAGWPKPPPSLVGETVAAVLNAPALLDSHDQIGVYAAISVQPGTAWHGCRIDYRLAGATNWESLGVFTTRSVMGVLLQDFAAGAEPYPDHSHHVVVRLLHDDIIESQSDVDWLNRAGGLAIVRPDGTVELVQSQFADHIDAQDWDLSCHQRGRLGTSADAHAAGARVVWLDSVIWLPLPETVIGQTLQFRFVAFGSTEETAPVHTITLDPPISQRELPVANLVLTREGGTIAGAWWERKRFGTDIHPIRSANWGGFLVTLTDGSTTESFETTEPGFSRPDSAFSGPITVTVAQLNRYTGAGPSISETI